MYASKQRKKCMQSKVAEICKKTCKQQTYSDTHNIEKEEKYFKNIWNREK